MSDEVHDSPIDTPIDETAKDAFASQGLRFTVLRSTDDTFPAWYHAMNRGFNGPIAEDAELPARAEGMAGRRISGLYDDSAADAETPIATVTSWVADVTVPGSRTVPAWAISTVTVAPTLHRRGIARNL